MIIKDVVYILIRVMVYRGDLTNLPIGYILVIMKTSRGKWLKSFVFRGLKFREHSEGIGVQVYHPKHRRWYAVEALNWRTSKHYYSIVPDVGLWIDRTYHGSLRFPN